MESFGLKNKQKINFINILLLFKSYCEESNEEDNDDYYDEDDDFHDESSNKKSKPSNKLRENTSYSGKEQSAAAEDANVETIEKVLKHRQGRVGGKRKQNHLIVRLGIIPGRDIYFLN